MPSLILLFLAVWLILSLLLAAWTMFFQGYIYSEPAGALHWRAPAAAAALTLFVVVWVVFDYRSIQEGDKEGRYHPLHESSSSEVEIYDDLWIVNIDGNKEHYERKGDNQYRDKRGKTPPSRPSKIIASRKAEGDQQHVFEPQLDAQGHFKIDNDKVRYYDKDNKSRYMDEGQFGQISIFHFGWLLMTLILNFGFLIVWFVSLWLLLRFQWAHALGLALAAWLIGLFVLPMILTKAENVRKERLSRTVQTANGHGGRLPIPVRE